MGPHTAQAKYLHNKLRIDFSMSPTFKIQNSVWIMVQIMEIQIIEVLLYYIVINSLRGRQIRTYTQTNKAVVRNRACAWFKITIKCDYPRRQNICFHIFVFTWKFPMINFSQISYSMLIFLSWLAIMAHRLHIICYHVSTCVFLPAWPSFILSCVWYLNISLVANTIVLCHDNCVRILVFVAYCVFVVCSQLVSYSIV